MAKINDLSYPQKLWISLEKENPWTTLYDDNAVCVTQLKGGDIKEDRTKHISPRFFFTHDLQKKDDIDMQ